MTEISNNISPDFIEELRLCLKHGYIDKETIITWADELITKFHRTENILIDISSTSNHTIDDLSYILNCYVGDIKPKYAGRLLLSFIYKDLVTGNLTEKQVAQKLYNYSIGEIKPQTDNEICRQFNYHYYIAETGIRSTLKQIKKEINDFLAIYQQYHFNNYDEWKNFHSIVDNSLKLFTQTKV